MEHNPQFQQPPNPPQIARGILKQWNPQRKFGIVYCPEGKRYFLHASEVIEGVPELYRRIAFEIGERRRPEDLEPACNARVGEKVAPQ